MDELIVNVKPSVETKMSSFNSENGNLADDSRFGISLERLERTDVPLRLFRPEANE